MTDPNPACLPPFGGSGIYHPSISFPLGEWEGIANGRRFVLNITSVDSAGNVEGVYDSRRIQRATWSETEQLLDFRRVEPDPYGDGRALVQHFQGYLMAYDDIVETKWRIAGIFRGTITDPKKPAGWYATLPMGKE